MVDDSKPPTFGDNSRDFAVELPEDEFPGDELDFDDAEVEAILKAFNSRPKRKKASFVAPEVGTRDPQWMKADGRPASGPITRVEDKKVYAIHSGSCARCGGRGGSEHWPGYVCFRCRGARVETREVRLYTADEIQALGEAKERRRLAKLQARADAREAKRLERIERRAYLYKEIVDAHPELFERLARLDAEAKDPIAADILGKIREFGNATERQLEFLGKICDQIVARETSVSRYVGRVGERLDRSGVCVSQTSFLRGAHGGRFFGESTLYIAVLQDTGGNVYKLTASKPFDFEKGDTVDFRGTVKDHREYKGVRQTAIFRVKILHIVSQKELNGMVEDSARAKSELRSETESNAERRPKGGEADVDPEGDETIFFSP